jgi:hypothetical protein
LVCCQYQIVQATPQAQVQCAAQQVAAAQQQQIWEASHALQLSAKTARKGANASDWCSLVTQAPWGHIKKHQLGL